MVQIKSKIIFNNWAGDRYFHLAMDGRELIKDSKPGMFLEIRVNDGYEPLLRRPISIHSIKGRNLEILYEVVGQGTEILSTKKPGKYLDVIGPLGNGFKIKSPVTSHQLSVLVAGGMGAAPLVFLTEKLTECKMQNVKCKSLILIGAKTKDHLLCEKEFRGLGCEVKIATDDGSKGFRGRVTDLLQPLLLTHNSQFTTIYACGPKPMLKEISNISQQYKIPAQVSLEAHMACGIGACLGCVVNTREGFKRVCKEGPVFNADEIVWEE